MADEEDDFFGEGEEEEKIPVTEEEEEEVEAESILTEYDADDFYSGAVTSLDSTIPTNLFEFEYSFGYDCLKHFNLCACDDTVVCFASGSIITFLDVNTKQTWFRRTTTGGSVGNITSYRKDPNYRIAIAECREGPAEPLIILYTWPQMEIDAVLRDGTINAYSIMDFSPDGELLASVGREPDYNLTIWNWKRHKILLRTSAFTFDVNAVQFSPYCPGQLTTAGAAHIKFWKMAETFTGLKLKGELGRFGKTEICDVLGVYPMPDEKVLSGCEWGNVLVWEAGLVKVEVTQRGRRRCHQAPVVREPRSKFVLSSEVGALRSLPRSYMFFSRVILNAPTLDLTRNLDQSIPDLKFPRYSLILSSLFSGLNVVKRRDKKIQFMLSLAGDEVTTIARDGCVRAWYWDTVEQADPPEEDPFVELNPVAETCVPGCQIMCLRHQKDLYWYAQDGNGGLWTVDLEIDKVECNHRKVMTSHSGGVVSMAVLRTHPILITAGDDGAIQAYSTSSFLILAKYSFPSPITCLFYPPPDVDPTSRIILVGFADGIMRMLFLHPDRIEEGKRSMINVRVESTMAIHSEESLHADVIDLICWLKPHSKALSQIVINDQRTLLVTCGEDSTIFMYNLVLESPFQLQRLGYIETPNNIAYMTFKPTEERVLLLCGQVGLLMEAILPDVEVRKYSEITTFKLDFVSYTETLVRKHYMRNRPMPTEEDLASLDEEALKAKEEAERDKDDEDETEWIGEIELIESESMLGTTLTWAEYCEDGIWVVQRGTGALFLVKPGVSRILKYAPIPGAWCDDITCLRFVCEKSYLIIGTNTGYIRVFRMPTEDEDNPNYHYEVWITAMQKLLKKLKGRRLAKEELQPTPRLDFFDSYYLPMHDRYTGAITCFQFNSEGTHFYTCGKDGNIFSFRINFHEPLLTHPSFKTETAPKMEKIPEPSTLEGELMSHEQLKQKEEYDKMMAIANAHKKRVRDQLAELTIEYNKVIKANRLLAVSQQIDVTLDDRPLAVQEKELEEAKALTIRKLAHQLEASDLGLFKMYSRNIIQLDVYPFILTAIRDPRVIIRPLRQKNLSKAFFAQLEEVYQKMAEAALRGRRAESVGRRAVARRASLGAAKVASFLLGLPSNPPHVLKKALRNYHQRLNRHHLQFIEWQEHLSLKPDPNALPPGAAEALAQAEATIGNRLLKTQPDYVASPGHNTQLRLCMLRKEIYDNKRAFNEKVLELREHKLKLITKMKSIGERLSEIRIEIPAKFVKPPPPIPQIDNDLEFPEKNLEVKPEPVQLHHGRGQGKKPGISEGRRSGIFPQMRIRAPRVHRFVPLIETRPLAVTWELIKHRNDQEATPIEIEVRDRRIKRHLYEQDMLLADAEESVRQFDSRLRQLQRERIRVQEKNQLLELHHYQLHREINVLNRFEAHEDRLAERVYVKLMQVKGVQDQILDCEHRIEDHKAEKEQLDLSCQELQRQFKKLVQDNKFADFLRRIFKKKYRPPRDHDNDDSEESESESSSSEEEDEGSLDSRDIGPIRLDPNICPEGCDSDIYETTYELRNTRHKYEQNMLEQDRLVDLLRKDIDAHNKIKRKLSIQLEKRKNILREMMLQKQSNMNDVTQVVVLRYDQMRARALRGCTDAKGLSDTVVFPEQLLLKLRQRVLEIQEEIKQQKQRQKINRTHLHRMNVDLRAMESQAQELRAQMRDVLTKKLGKPRKVDKTLDDLLRQMARRHKFRATMDFVPQMTQQINDWKDRFSKMEKKYFGMMKTYSERLRLASALQAEILPEKPLKDPTAIVGSYSADQYQRDVIRLRIIRDQQMQHIQELSEEIHNLKTKPLAELSTWSKAERPPSARSDVDLQDIHRTLYKGKQYFPITPIGSAAKLIHDVNITKLLYDCLDSMKISRDEANKLLKELTEELPSVLSGVKSRYEVVDALVRKWLLKYGGDPSLYKKQTRAFDNVAALADRLIREHTETMEGKSDKDHKVMETLEGALRQICAQQDGDGKTLQERLALGLAALCHTGESGDLDTTETMASLVNALMDEELPFTKEDLDNIVVADVISDVKDCGVFIPVEEIEHLVSLAIKSLKSQIMTDDEEQVINDEIDLMMTQELKSESSSRTSGEQSRRSSRTT